MSHEIEQMMFTGETPWHGLGVELPAAPTTGEAIVAAGLDWEVATKNLKLAEDDRPVPQARATVRVSDGRILGIVGPSYTPLQNREAFSFFDPFLAAGSAKLETAGSLRGGRRVWIQARINSDPIVIVPGTVEDAIEKFLLLSNGHDGSLCVRAGLTPRRVVCQNTLSMAHNDIASRLLRVTHHSKVADAVEAMRDAMHVASAAFEATAEQYRQLARLKVNTDDLRAYVKRVFKITGKPAALASADDETPVGEEQAEEEGSNRGARILERVEALFEGGRGADLPGVRGTMWGAYNAVNEYVGYERGRDKDIRLDSLWFGQGAVLNRRALAAATEAAKAA